MSSTDTLYLIFLTTGFTVGFGHCIGMCGPIVVSLSLNLRERGVLVPQLLYNVGRVTTYGILGGLMGFTGSFTGVTSNIAGLQRGVMIFAGTMIIVMGLAMSGWIPLGRIFGDHYNPDGLISRGFHKFSASKSTITFLPLGLLLGLLPCGPVYTALIAAARAGMEATGSLEGFLTGMGIMLCFGLGTIPALMLIVGVYFVIKGILY